MGLPGRLLGSRCTSQRRSWEDELLVDLRECSLALSSSQQQGTWENPSIAPREPHFTCLENLSSGTLVSDMHMLNHSEASDASSPLTPFT